MKIAFFSDSYMPGGRALDPFRAQLLKSVCRVGQEVLYLQANDYLNHSGEFLSKKGQAHVLEALERFQPDVIFSLNRAGLHSEVVKTTRASIVSWYIDNPNRFPESQRRFAPSEKIYCATRYMVNWLKRQDSPVDAEYLPFCTDEELFKPDPSLPPQRKCDLSFVGTLWEPTVFQRIAEQVGATNDGKNLFLAGLREYTADYDSDFPTRLRRIYPERTINEIRNALDDFLSTRRRLDYLEKLSDLNIEIYGTSSWLNLSILRSDALFEKFVSTPLETPEDLAQLYQRSRVAISIAHQQAQSGFPIRIFDILSSGVPLVTDRHVELSEHFEEGKHFLAGDTPEEASESVRRILREPELATRLGEAGRNEILSRHTFRRRLESLLGASPRFEPCGAVTLVSEALNPAFLVDDPRFAHTRCELARYTSTAMRPLPTTGAHVSLFRRMGKLAVISAYIGWLLLRLGVAKLFRRGGSSAPISDFLRNVVRKQSEVLSDQLRVLLVQLSDLKQKKGA